jgi:hypothetical protein
MHARVAAAIVGIVTGQVSSPPPPEKPRVLPGVEVERVVIDARAISPGGGAIVGLGPRDFRVRVDGRVVDLESVEWVPGALPAETRSGGALAASPGEPAPGRLILLVFEKDLESSRVVGFMKMLHRAEELVSRLRPDDRLAIASFDHHLKLWLDFTTDHERARPLLRRGLVFEDVAQAEAGPPPSLAAFFDTRAARDAACLEQALLVLGRALSPLPGAKSVVLFGAGMGRFTPEGVILDAAYEPARRALSAAQATVFSLDVTDADRHSLEVGLQQVASDTGGFYARTHEFPAIALAQLEGALEGRYVLAFPRPDGRRGAHDVRVDLPGRKGSVVSRTTYVD